MSMNENRPNQDVDNGPLDNKSEVITKSKGKVRVVAAVTAFALTVSLVVTSAVLFSSNNTPLKNDPDLLGIPANAVTKIEAMGVKYYKDKMSLCIDTYGSVQQMNTSDFIAGKVSPAADCVLKVFFEASDRLDIRNIVTATAAQVAETPGLYLVCHGLAHRAAKRAYVASGENARILLEQVPFRTCDDGFVHGIFDAVAHIYGADGAEFKDVMNTCIDLGKDPVKQKEGAFTFSQCGDGSGHVLYLRADKDVMRTADLCSEFQESDIRRWCIMGAMMEEYKPYFSTWSEKEENELVAGITERCKKWPKNLQAIAGADVGCYSAGGYLFNNVAQSHTAQILQRAYADKSMEILDSSGILQPESVLPEARIEIENEYRKVAERCDSFPEKGRFECYYIVFPLMPIQIRNDKEFYNTLCTNIPYKELRDLCVNTRLWGMGAF